MAKIIQNIFGMPLVNATKHHIMMAALNPSPSVPKKQEVKANLKLIYFNRNFTSISENVHIVGMSLGIDEMKIQEHLQWDPRTNMILEVCREHSHQCTLEFRSLAQADMLLECLKRKVIHLVTEVSPCII